MMKYIMLTLICLASTVDAACPAAISGVITVPREVTFPAGVTQKHFLNLGGPPVMNVYNCTLVTKYLRGSTTTDGRAEAAKGVEWQLYHNLNGTAWQYGQYYTNPAFSEHWMTYSFNRINMRIWLKRPYTGALEIPDGAVGSYEFKERTGASLGVGVLSLSSPIRLNVTGCVLNTPHQAVDLGNILTSEFSGVGRTAGRKRDATFELDCGNLNTDTTVMLDGTRAHGAKGVLALNPGTGQATGVGVQLFVNSKATALGDNTGLGRLSPGLNSFTVGAQYIQTAATITPGTANASATINVTYR